MNKFLAFATVILISFSGFGQVPDISGLPVSNDIFSISTGPGENASIQMGISWAVETSVQSTSLFYTTEDDAGWENAIKVLPQQNEICTVFQGVASDREDGTAWKEDAVFVKCGAMLTNLRPDTRYKYAIVETSGEEGLRRSSVHHFETAGAKSWSACIISDFHSYTPLPKRLEAAMGMIDTMKDYDPSLDFIFSPGDVVAWGGSYSFWRRLFEEPNFENFMWARVNGNHDNWTKESQVTRNFNIPNHYFTSTSYFPQNGYAGELGVCYHFRYGNTLFLMLNTEDMSAPGEFEAAADWVRSVVKAARASSDAPTFTVVCMHYEWFIGTNGRTSQYGRWSPVFDEVGIDLAVAGNNHVYLRTLPLYDGQKTDGSRGTVYMQTTASDNDRGRSLSEDPMQNPHLIETRWTEGAHSVSAIHLDVNSKRMKLDLLDRNGKEIDGCIIPAKKRP